MKPLQTQHGSLETLANNERSRVQTARWVGVSIVLIAILASVGFLSTRRALKEAQKERVAFGREIQATSDGYASAVAALQRQLMQAETKSSTLQAELTAVGHQVEVAQNGIASTRRQTRELNDRQREAISTLAAIDNTNNEVKTQLAAKASSEDIRAIGGEVDSVRDDLNATKNDLEMTRSEMGTLIAKNHDDIETLRRLGERDYFEFSAGKNTPQKMGDVAIELRSTDPKKNHCNLSFVVEDKRIEKRDRSVDEPIFFYLRGARQPIEIVINQIEKNRVAGYLSVPKAKQSVAFASGN